MLRIGESFGFSVRYRSYLLGVFYALAALLLAYLSYEMVESMKETLSERLAAYFQTVGGTAMMNNMASRQQIIQQAGPGAVRIVFSVIGKYSYGLFFTPCLYLFVIGVAVVWARRHLFIKNLTPTLSDFFIAVCKVALLNVIPLLLVFCFFRFQLKSFENAIVEFIVGKQVNVISLMNMLSMVQSPF